MNWLKKLFLNRNFILIMAVVLGLAVGDWAVYLKKITFYVLAVVMTFSTTGISTRSLFPLKKIVKPFLTGILLNYFVFGTVCITAAWLLMPDKELFYGFVVIAATPPGVAIIPFSGILKGDLKYSIIGVLGAFLASVILAPLMVGIFAGSDNVNTLHLFFLMLWLIIVPMLVSRLLLYKKIFPAVSKIRGKVVDWGFAIIIYTAVGLNRDVFFSDFRILLLSSLVLFISVFLLGTIYEVTAKKILHNQQIIMSQTLLVTVKSSGVSVVMALSLFGTTAAIPSAIMAVFVLLYLLYLSFRIELKKRK
ncbi:MAG TPA: hypothetical protein VE912_20215 [Bacteroidales bacterium]|nr:hypothetical protein [Bacteroidales bacterium]